MKNLLSIGLWGVILTTLIPYGIKAVPPNIAKGGIILSLIVIACGCIAKWRESSRKKATLTLKCTVGGIDHVAGALVEGIISRAGYSHMQLIIQNPSSENYLDLDVLVNPEYSIIDARAHSDFVECRIAIDGAMPSPIMFAVGDKGPLAIGHSDGTDEDIDLGPPYRLYCAQLPAQKHIIIDMATVAMNNDPTTPMIGTDWMWLPERHDPNFIDIVASYTAYGVPQLEKVRLATRIVKFELPHAIP